MICHVSKVCHALNWVSATKQLLPPPKFEIEISTLTTIYQKAQ